METITAPAEMSSKIGGTSDHAWQQICFVNLRVLWEGPFVDTIDSIGLWLAIGAQSGGFYPLFYPFRSNRNRYLT